MARNVIIFGEPSVGKSSIINMLSGKDVACTYNACLNPDHRKSSKGKSVSLSCRFQSHEVYIDKQPFRLHEATAFNSDGGEADTTDIAEAYKLIQQLDSGVSLLVFCMRAPRITEGSRRNWNLFYEIFCRRAVPIVAVIIGLENELDMNAWYRNNERHFNNQDMFPKDGAGITAIKGREDPSGKPIFQQEFDASTRKIQQLIKSSYLTVPWRMERVEWFNYYVPRIVDIKVLWFKIAQYQVKKKKQGAVHGLVKLCGMKHEDAIKLAKVLQEAAGDSK